jgi:ribosomal protein L37E
MPVLSRCPLCRGLMPDSHGGESRCRRCGELVLPAIRKLCAGCGTDLTRGKRVRDESNGEYYCHDCWDKKLATQSEVVDQLCNTCGLVFAANQVYQDGDAVVCKDCYAQRAGDPDALAYAAAAGGASAPDYDPTASTFDPTARYRRRTGTPWELVAFCIAAILALVVVVLVVTLGK